MTFRIQSVARAMEILEFLSRPPGRFPLGEIANRLGLPRTTVHGLIRTLCDGGLVQQDAYGDRYMLGATLLKHGHQYLLHSDLRSRCIPWIQWLSERTDMSCEVAVPYWPTSVLVILQTRRSGDPIQATTVGAELGLTRSALGRAVLAYRLPPGATKGADAAEHLDASIPREEVTRAVRGVRRHRLATDLDPEESGQVAVAAPVFNADGDVVAAIGAVGPRHDLTKEEVAAVSALVQQAARGASNDLGAARWPAS